MNRDGFTLIESVISIALVSLLVVGSLLALGASTRSQRVQLDGRRATVLAYELMNEIAPLAYDDPEPGAMFGPEPGEGFATRANWDDIDDYHGWTSSPPQNRAGAPITAADGWARAVHVTHVTADDPDGLGRGSDGGLRRITVTVTAPGGAQARLVALRSRPGPIDAATEDLLALSWIGAELQVGADPAARLASGTAVLNQAAPVPPNMLVNPGIEEGISPWWGDTCDLQLRSTESHGGLLSLRAKNRTFRESGPAQNLSGLENGASYDIEGWMKMHDTGTSATAQIVLLWYDGIEIRSATAGDTIIDDTAWRPIRATVTPTWNGPLQWAYVKIRTLDDTDSFLIDDVSMTRVAE